MAKHAHAIRESFDLSICVDCLCYLANGQVPEDRPSLANEINSVWPADDGWHLAPACDEHCEGWFAWSQCDCCHSQLGGERHPGVAYTRVLA